jgi:hypothetical protein
MTGLQVSCVSGTINRLELLKRMVESVRKSAAGLSYELVLVDCNSNDGTRAWLRTQRDVVLIEHDEPRGSAIAFQDGFEHARGKYVVTLNDDIAVEGSTIRIAYDFLERNPHVGQVAFGHKYLNRKGQDGSKAIVQKQYGGYEYAQCGMTRRWLGDLAGWTGTKIEGYKHYAWDNYLSGRIWEMGYRVVAVPGCSVLDWEHEDAIRTEFSDGPRAAAGGVHPDTVTFRNLWKDRLPPRRRWIPATGSLERRILAKAANRTLRTLRFKGMMHPSHTMRHALIDEFHKYGVARQVNQTASLAKRGIAGYQDWALKVVENWKPDLVMLQAQRDNNIMPHTISEMRRRNPDTFIFNWDGDTHYPLAPFHFDVARESHLQLTVSPSLFPEYISHGAPNVGYWPIGVEYEYMDVKRPAHPQGPDVTFLGALYGIGMFPEATTRRDRVKELWNANKRKKLKFVLQGNGWRQIGIQSPYTGERHEGNAKLYARSKMALSISQTKDLWGYTSDRAYNICATGCPILVQRFEGMEEHGFIDGRSCIAWDTSKEMFTKIDYYLKHEDEREEIGRRGREMVLTRHNWAERVKRLWAILGGMDCG